MTKKLIIPVIVLIVLFAMQSCDSQKVVLKDVPESKLDNTYTVNLNDTLKIKLSSNPSTGYKWKIASKIKPGIIKEISNEFVKEEKTMNMVGGGGYDLWTFSTKKTGILFLHFKYEREDGKIKNEKYIKIEVK
ncbi:MAG: protease inhibitor I42 family protein [Bacteroidales bacterium]|nr:protease inhibitor I42 family protein [Bacteroidales bacterium]